jgi:hypothetical protein
MWAGLEGRGRGAGSGLDTAPPRANLHAGIPRFEPVVLVERVGRQRLVDVCHRLHVTCAQGLAPIQLSSGY